MSNLQESQQIQLLVTHKLEREDIFKLYIVKRFDSLDNLLITPDTDIKGLLDRNAVQFLYISDMNDYYSTEGNFIYASVTLQSLNDRLADSGYSIANYVQAARAGEGYAWPRLRIKEAANPNLPLAERIEVIVDPWKTIDVGVWGCQVKIDNTAIIHSVRLMGYPATWYPPEDHGGLIKYHRRS